jgi:hypothetical protein
LQNQQWKYLFIVAMGTAFGAGSSAAVQVKILTAQQKIPCSGVPISGIFINLPLGQGHKHGL